MMPSFFPGDWVILKRRSFMLSSLDIMTNTVVAVPDEGCNMLVIASGFAFTSGNAAVYVCSETASGWLDMHQVMHG